MGKGFEAVHGCEGLDLTELIMESCQKRVSPTREILGPYEV